MSMRRTNLSAATTWSLITVGCMFFVCLLVVLAPFAEAPESRAVYPAVGITTLVFLVATVCAVLVIQPVRIRVARWSWWLATAATIVLTLGPISLWYLQRHGLGFQVFQGLRVGTGPYGFGDAAVVLSWLDCWRVGIDPYSAAAEVCALSPANYGPAILWLTPLGLSVNATLAVGVLIVLTSALAIGWLTRQSRGFGRVAIVLVSFSPAWILLLERANLDAVVISAGALLVFLVRRFRGLAPWIAAACVIWVLGAWKFYPFAMIGAFTPVVRVRHGWSVIAGFLALCVLYLVAEHENVLLSLESNAGLSDGTLGGFGRDIAAAFVTGEAQAATNWQWGDFLILATMTVAFVWGWVVVGECRLTQGKKGLQQVPLTAESMLAIGGAFAILIPVGASGFGWNYKAAFLILGIPLLARLTWRLDRPSFQAGVFIAVLSVAAMFVLSNALLASLAVLVSAGFVGGAASRPLLAWLLPPKPITKSRS